jgi:hypothetical protein
MIMTPIVRIISFLLKNSYFLFNMPISLAVACCFYFIGKNLRIQKVKWFKKFKTDFGIEVHNFPSFQVVV